MDKKRNFCIVNYLTYKIMKIRALIIAGMLATHSMAFAQNDSTGDNISTAPKQELTLTQQWDKTFPKSDKVEHKKVTFHNRFGITLAADMYIPKVVSSKKSTSGKFPAIAVSGPFGAVKEQSSGLYAQTLAERGFLTIAFDPSFTGESSGDPRNVASPDLNTEDFSAAVDYLATNGLVDADRIGILGICGWGGLAINAAANDPRIKATVASTMYNMTRVNTNGYFDKGTAEQRYQTRIDLNNQRTEDYRDGTYKRTVMNPKPTDDAPQFMKDYYDYYKTKRGYHERSINSGQGWNATSNLGFMNSQILQYAGEIRNAVLIVHGEKAHSLYMGEDAFKLLNGDNKQFIIVPGASHCDLYDKVDIIPFDKIEQFYDAYLK